MSYFHSSYSGDYNLHFNICQSSSDFNTNLISTVHKTLFLYSAFSSLSFVVLLSQITLLLCVLYAHQHKFIIIFLCYYLLGEKSCEQKIHLYCFCFFKIFTCFVTFIGALYFFVWIQLDV